MPSKRNSYTLQKHRVIVTCGDTVVTKHTVTGVELDDLALGMGELAANLDQLIEVAAAWADVLPHVMRRTVFAVETKKHG